jgi:hypothetical protein
VCGMFLSSALKAQEEHYKLHTAVSLLKVKHADQAEDVDGAQATAKPSGDDTTVAGREQSAPVEADAVRTHTQKNR